MKTKRKKFSAFYYSLITKKVHASTVEQIMQSSDESSFGNETIIKR